MDLARQWRIYHASSEYARELGDPCLGTVWAKSKEQAELIAPKKIALWMPTGAWAVPA